MKIAIPKDNSSALDYVNEAKKLKAKIIESTVYQGMACKIVSSYNPTDNIKSKLWVRTDFGFPVRVETSSPKSKMVVEYKNMKLGPIPASVFTIPAGTKIVDMSKITTKMPNTPKMP
jgi:outer membrane lipoprotein-sorting protein